MDYDQIVDATRCRIVDSYAAIEPAPELSPLPLFRVNEDLVKRIAGLSDRIAVLEARLRPLLRPGPVGVPRDDDPPREPMSDVVAAFYDQADKIEAIDTRVLDVLARLEV